MYPHSLGRFDGCDWRRTAVLIDGNQHETTFRAKLPLASQQILGPQFDLDRERSSSYSDDAAHNFSELSLAYGNMKINTFGTSCYDRPPRMSRRRHKSRHVHQAKRIATEKCPVVVRLIRKHHLDNTRFLGTRGFRSRHGKPLHL